MSVLLDTFSYRYRISDGGIYFNRWHEGYYPMFNTPERIYFLKNIINTILFHDVIYIRMDALEEFIEIMGIEATNLLISKRILIILEGWPINSFLLNSSRDDLGMFMNSFIPTEIANKNIVSRLKQKYSRSQISLINYTLNYELCAPEDPSLIDQYARDRTYEDINNTEIRGLFNIKSKDSFSINEDDMVSVIRLHIINRTLEWSNELKTGEILLENAAKNLIAFKSGYIKEDTILYGLKEIFEAKSIPNLSYLYENKILSINDILKLRDNIDGVKFRDWIKSKDYNLSELRKSLMAKVPENKLISLLRFSVITGIGIGNTKLGIAAGLIDNFLPSYKKWTPAVYFDDVISTFFKKRYWKKNVQ